MIPYLQPLIAKDSRGLLVISQVCGEDLINERLLSGREGEIIMSLFKDAGLKAREFSFAAAVDQKDPPDDACLYRLRRTIKYINPEYIIAMGNVALHVLTKKSGIKNYRGTRMDLREVHGIECPVYPTYSVQDLRNVPTFKRTIIADLRNTQKQDSSDDIQFSYWR
jgi:uracil-DNA glycosylase